MASETTPTDPQPGASLLPCPSGAKDCVPYVAKEHHDANGLSWDVWYVTCSCGWSTPEWLEEAGAVGCWNTRSDEREAGRVAYTCQDCGAAGVRLYREYQTFLDHQRLRCTTCALKHQGRTEPDGPHSIGWLVAAMPTEDGSTYWGFTSAPIEAVRWWDALPDAKERP